jgi:predicted transcriptional regulator
MIYLAAPPWDESRNEYRTAWLLRLNETRFFAFVYKPDASTPNRLILEDENGDILRYDLNEYKMVCSRSASEGCGTWEYWNLRLEGYTMEVSVLSWTSSGDPQERTLLSNLLHSTEPISLIAGVLFLVRVPPNDKPATTSTPLPAKQPTPAPTPAPKPFQLTPTPAKQHEAKSDDRFMPTISDETLRMAGLTRAFVKAVWRVIQQHGKVSTRKITEQLGLPVRSRRLSAALSFLVQEGLVYQEGQNRYSSKPTHYRPATDDQLLRVLDVICQHPGIGNEDLARLTGLSTTSIIDIVRYLASQGLIRREVSTLNTPCGARAMIWLHYPAERTGGQR